MHFIFVHIVLLLSKYLSLAKVVFVILVIMFMLKIEPLNLLLKLLTVIIITLFLLFLKSFVSSFVKIILLFIYFLKLLHKPFCLGLLLKTKKHFVPGFISTLHTFGRDLKWNPHIHVLITEEVSGHSTVWQPFKHISYPMLCKRFQTTLMDLLGHKFDKSSFYLLECYLFKTYRDRFYVYAKNLIHVPILKRSQTMSFIISVVLL